MGLTRAAPLSTCQRLTAMAVISKCAPNRSLLHPINARAGKPPWKYVRYTELNVSKRSRSVQRTCTMTRSSIVILAPSTVCFIHSSRRRFSARLNSGIGVSENKVACCFVATARVDAPDRVAIARDQRDDESRLVSLHERRATWRRRRTGSALRQRALRQLWSPRTLSNAAFD
jgi:hypothetical protein